MTGIIRSNFASPVTTQINTVSARLSGMRAGQSQSCQIAGRSYTVTKNGENQYTVKKDFLSKLKDLFTLSSSYRGDIQRGSVSSNLQTTLSHWADASARLMHSELDHKISKNTADKAGDTQLRKDTGRISYAVNTQLYPFTEDEPREAQAERFAALDAMRQGLPEAQREAFDVLAAQAGSITLQAILNDKFPEYGMKSDNTLIACEQDPYSEDILITHQISQDKTPADWERLTTYHDDLKNAQHPKLQAEVTFRVHKDGSYSISDATVVHPLSPTAHSQVARKLF